MSEAQPKSPARKRAARTKAEPGAEKSPLSAADNLQRLTPDQHPAEAQPQLPKQSQEPQRAPADALEDPRFREQLQGLKDMTAVLNGEKSAPVRLSTDPKPERAGERTGLAAPYPEKVKPAGQAIFNLRDVPVEFRDAAKQRFGRAGEDMLAAPARENGSYKGDVLNGTEYLAQRVGNNSVVFHQKSAIDLISEKHRWQDKEQKLNGTQMAIHYDGTSAKAYPHDPQREELSKLVNTFKQHAAKLGLDRGGEFAQTLESVKESMLTQFKEREQAQKQQRQEQRARPPQEQQRPERQHQSLER